uniref:Uncharacterized protein n=1 Tax=Mucochytrium quahogii TaxID=96639 RepID=A0A7S2SK88_9STRA
MWIISCAQNSSTTVKGTCPCCCHRSMRSERADALGATGLLSHPPQVLSLAPPARADILALFTSEVLGAHQQMDLESAKMGPVLTHKKMDLEPAKVGPVLGYINKWIWPDRI